jgi:hypothetical protein
MTRDFFDPTPEEQIVGLVDATTVRNAERLIESCEACNPDAQIPFDNILDRVTGSDPSVTDYVLEEPAKCPNCKREDFGKDADRTQVNVSSPEPLFSLCAGCWKWVCDCIHCVEPLHILRQAVNDLWIRSLGYDRLRGRLEVEFTWASDVRQFHPVSPALYRQLLRAKPSYLFLDQQIMRATWIRSQYVRTEEKRAIMMVGIANEIVCGHLS